MGNIIRRLLDINLPKNRSAFLWGPRKTGKSYWLKKYYLKNKDHRFIDLLETDAFAEYASRPSLLRERWDAKPIIIDEIQKLPVLLDEIHWLIENKNASFLLTGSSARKLRHSHANLLGGRAWRYEMGPLSLKEIANYNLEQIMISGLLPPHFLSPNPEMDLRSYIADYLKDEIAIEARIQNIPAFSNFLYASALTNGELLNYKNLGSEAGISPKVARHYFEILEDTMIGLRLSPWKKSRERRMIQTEKFYFFDLGVANFLARRKPLRGSLEFGKSFEHLVLMELLNFKRYREPDLEIFFWRTSTDLEVDFILGAPGKMITAIEVKGSNRVTEKDYKNLKILCEEHRVENAIVVCLEKEQRKVEKNIQILPFETFLNQLWSGKLK